MKAVLQPNWSHFTVVEIKWFLFVKIMPDALSERLLTVMSPYIINIFYTYDRREKTEPGKKAKFRHWIWTPKKLRRTPRLKVRVSGNCCWEIQSTRATGGRTEKFALGTQNRTPRFAFIKRARPRERC